MKKLFTLLLTLPLAAAVWSAETPPCKMTFTSQEEFDRWKMVDANDDGSPYCFVYNSTEQAAYYKENRSKDADDWMISPVVALTAGKQYQITVNVKQYSTYGKDTNKFTVSYGSSQTVDDMSAEVLKVEDLTKNKYGNVYVDIVSQIFTVETTGDYCFGLHLYSAGYNGDFGLKSLTVSEFVELPEIIAAPAVSPAALGEMKAEISWIWPSKSNIGTTLSSLSGAKIYRAYMYKTDLIIDDAHCIATVTEGATPGAQGSFTDTNFSEGNGTYYYAIVPFNENGASLATPEAASAWIGEDTSLKAVTNATAELNDDGHVLLSWTAPAGSNGAYINPSKISYRIERGSDILAESWTGDLPYIDLTVPDAGTYTYTIIPLYDGKAGFSKSVSITVKGVVPLPYSNTFEDRNSVEFFTFVHAAPSKNDWSFYSQSIRVYESAEVLNSYAFMPPFNLEAGKTYAVTFKTKLSGASSKNLAVVYGAAASADGEHTEVFSEAITATEYVEKNATFTVPANGKYYVGFHFKGGTKDYKDIYVDDVKVEELVLAPAAVSDGTVAVGAEGALEATISWINPSTTNAGSELASLTKVELSRNGDIILTSENGKIGMPESFTDKGITMPGVYTYTITPYLGDVAGKAVEVTSEWIGCDFPKAPASVVVTDNANARTIAFTPVTESLNGGYMPAELSYTIMRNGVTLAEDVAASPFEDSEADMPLGFYTYEVYAHYADVKGAPALSEAIKIGELLRLPYKPSFTNAKEFELWTLDKGSGNNSWEFDNDWYHGLAIYGAYNSWAYTPPFMAAEGKIIVNFRGACQSTTAENLTVCLVREADEAEANAVAGEWQPEIVGATTEYTIDQPWSGSDFTLHTLELNVPADGKYRVGFGVNVGSKAAGKGRFVLKQADIEQVKRADAPTFDPESGAVEKDTPVYIICATEGASIYYTTDGTDPKAEESELYDGSAIVVDNDMTIKAIAVAEGYTASIVATATYTVEGDVSKNPTAQFDFTQPDKLYPAKSNPTETEPVYADDVTFYNNYVLLKLTSGAGALTSNRTQLFLDDDEVHMCSFGGSKMTITVAESLTIEKIEFVGATAEHNLHLIAPDGNLGVYSVNGQTGTWTRGPVNALSNEERQSITFNTNAGDAHARIKSITVTTAGIPTGVENVVIDENASAEYYNLQGVRVVNPESGIYIRRQGNKVTKVLVK